MNIKPLSVPRSDLAIELAQSLLEQENTCEKSSKTLPEGLSVHTKKHGSVEITCVKIITLAVAQKLQKPRGRYITIQTPPLWNSLLDPQDEINAAADCIRELLPSHGSVLVAGLGNNRSLPDARDRGSINRILLLAILKESLQSRLVLILCEKLLLLRPGVMGQTGIETGEILSALVNFIRPDAVIAVDALAAQDYSHLGKTIQISDSGISPGSGVQNSRKEISEKTMGIPVISIGVPTVIDGATLTAEFSQKPKEEIDPSARCAMVTPREVDRMIGHSAKFISLAINKALYPELSSGGNFLPVRIKFSSSIYHPFCISIKTGK